MNVNVNGMVVGHIVGLCGLLVDMMWFEDKLKLKVDTSDMWTHGKWVRLER